MRALSGDSPFVDLQRVAIDDPQVVAEFPLELRERRHATAVAFHRHDRCAGVKEGAGQAARAGPDLVDALTLELARDRSDAGEELAVEDEILSERFACAQPMPGDDVA
jgi:hypothetical protein